MKKTLLMLTLVPFFGLGQAIINSWQMNSNGQTASYWSPTGNPPNTTYSYVTTSDSTGILKKCYNSDSVWIYSHGMVFNMGKYLNPGSCSSKNYIYRFPRNPVVPTIKTISSKVGAIGCLVNGIPMYGLGDSKSWNGSTNSNNGQGIWNVEVYMGEGVSLDTAFSAHPQQQGAYHSHAKPRRLYQSTPTSQHSPIIGFAFDGYPVYGPYGYSTATSSTSAVSRMKTGYSLRSITTRTAPPYGVVATQSGPPVNGTYPIGTYCEDYEWLASNGGDLDKYNGRFCVTPEYPAGTYAYFTTIDVAQTPQFPYYIGIEYYGKPDPTCAGSGTSTGVKFPVPTVNVSGATSAACAGAIVNLTASGAASYSWNTGATTASIAVSPTINTSYTVTAITATGCAKSAVTTVTVANLPIVSISGSTAVCAGSTASLTASGASTYSWNTGASGASLAVSPATGTSYTATGTNSSGCSASAIISVAVNPLPSVSAVSNTSLLCIGQSAVLTGSGASTYSWSTSANTASTTVSPVVTTVYTVTGTDSNGCSKTFTISQNVTDCTSTGIAMLSGAQVFLSIYPNPNNGEFIMTSDSDLHLSIMNELGQLVKSMTLNESNDHGVFVSEMSTGVYFVVGHNGQQVITQKIIVSK